ncbi:MAG: TIGR03032 family protein [Pseudomonadota bacterium]
MTHTTTLERPETAGVQINASRLFAAWLASTGSSLVMSTYQAGKIIMIGTKPDGTLSLFERTFQRPMGLAMGDGCFWASSLYQLWRFENFLEPGQTINGYDANFVPVTGNTTGDIDIHDIELDDDGAPVFVATRFNCLATLAERGSFRSLWMPPFIDRLAAEDRCHLNGLSFHNGRPGFATCVSGSTVVDGWRTQREEGGLVIDVQSNEIIVTGLSMPHSPRIYQDKLWLLQAGTGEFGFIDAEIGEFVPLCFLPGFARGLCFIGDHAVIGLSRPRRDNSFSGLELDARLASSNIQAQTGLAVVNLKTGDVEHKLTFSGAITELYDVQTLSGIRRPMFHGFQSEDIRFQLRPET